MKKIYLKLLASAFTLTTLLTSAPINGFSEVSAKSISSKNSGISPGAKVAIGVGVVGAVAAAVLGATYFLTRDSDGISSDNSKNKNGNLTNTHNLCYWHAFVQQMYSLKSFRRFIDEVDLDGMKPETVNKIKAFRELFSEMNKGERIDENSSLAFANQILCKNVPTEVYDDNGERTTKNLPIVGYQRDISEVWTSYIQDVVIAYEKHIKINNGATVSFPSPNLSEFVKNSPAVVDDQFLICVQRAGVVGEDGNPIKAIQKVDFGNGTVNYKGKMFEVTAVSVHSGSGSGGHYYTYKKHGNFWYEYNDCAAGVPCVSWDTVKKDAETNCTMLTFTKK